MIPRTSSSSAPSKRKKWTEEEERTLIEKYASMSADGSLSRLRTRERRFRPIADHVNAVYHAADPDAFPFLWSWKDASTKVQNMRHQYLLVKQKLLSTSSSSAAATRPGSDGPDSADLDLAHQGVSLWPNFLRYRDVFGDHPLPPKPQDPHDDCDGDGDLGLGLGFDADGDGFAYAATADAADVAPAPPKKRKKKRNATEEEEEEEEEEEWEERMEKKREEWRKKIEEMLSHHRAEMEGIQERILQNQQNMISQVLGLVSNWAAPLVVGGIPDGATAASLGNPNNNHHHQYLSQMMQGLHQENGVAVEECRAAAGEAPEDQFIVD